MSFLDHDKWREENMLMLPKRKKPRDWVAICCVTFVVVMLVGLILCSLPDIRRWLEWLWN